MNKTNLSVYLTGAAAAMTIVSIAAFEILLGLALVAFLVERKTWRLPPITLPLSIWFAGTIISAALSGDARAAIPQVRKFYVYLMLFLVFAAFRKLADIRWLVLAWSVGASLSALWSFVQLERKYRVSQAAHQNFYAAYLGARITGFMGHWMTFSGEMMIVLLLIGAFVFFSTDRRWTAWLIVADVLISCGLIAAFTRSMWLGAFVGGVYLVWIWRKWMILAVPVLLGILLLANPFSVRERVFSAIHPNNQLDSNEHRDVTRRIGWEMIKAHPWFGIGPEEVAKQYKRYVPAELEPLPIGYYGHLHNIYIHYAAERGIPTALALMWALGQSLFDFIGALRGKTVIPDVRWILHGSIAVMIAVLLSGWYELNLGDSEVLGLVLAVIGCGYAAVVATKEAIP